MGERVKMNKTGLAITIASTLLLAGASVAGAKGAKHAAPPSGEAIFKSSCAECHPGGSNKVHAHKPIVGSEKLSSVAVFKSYLQSPVGHMPYYEYIVKDRATLKALYEYCKSLKPSQAS